MDQNYTVSTIASDIERMTRHFSYMVSRITDNLNERRTPYWLFSINSVTVCSCPRILMFLNFLFNKKSFSINTKKEILHFVAVVAVQYHPQYGPELLLMA